MFSILQLATSKRYVQFNFNMSLMADHLAKIYCESTTSKHTLFFCIIFSFPEIRVKHFVQTVSFEGKWQEMSINPVFCRRIGYDNLHKMTYPIFRE